MESYASQLPSPTFNVSQQSTPQPSTGFDVSQLSKPRLSDSVQLTMCLKGKSFCPLGTVM